MKHRYHCHWTLGIIFTLCFQLAKAQNVPQELGSCASLTNQFKQSTTNASHRNAKASLALKVSNQKAFTGTVNFSKSEENSAYLIGQLENAPNSSFLINVTSSSIQGHILFMDTKIAYEYTSDAQGNAYVNQVDINRIICIDNHPISEKSKRENAEQAVNSPEIFRLESNPGAGGCLYLDFDGETVTGTPWKGGATIVAAPSNMTDAQIRETWEMVSEDYRPFNINVTTNVNVFNTYAKTKRMKHISTTSKDVTSTGVAYLGSFTWNDDTPCWGTYVSSAKLAGEVSSHELGHTLRLTHDGEWTNNDASKPVEYFGGHGGASLAAPIMGGSYYNPVTQFSKGDYSAYPKNNSYGDPMQDDLAVISSITGVGYRTDLHGNTTATAKALVIASNGTVSASSNAGVIEKTSDLDFFSFTTSGGTVIINANGSGKHSDLNIELKLYNNSGAVLGTYNPAGVNNHTNNTTTTNMDASFSMSLAAGTYYISINGVGDGNPKTDGFSEYGSLGYYAISGTVPNTVTTPTYATIYQHCNYDASGYGIKLGLGNYTTAQLAAAGVANNDVSSLKVTSGYEVVLYDGDNFTGNSITVTGDNSCVVANNFNDLTSSLIIRVKTATPNVAPTVALTAPANNASYNAPASITISANASDADGSVSKVDFYNGSTLIQSDATSPYSINWTNVAAGTYSITAKATDNVGATKTTAAVTVTVKSVTTNPNVAPTVALTAPINNASYNAPASITISANASDADGSVSKVDFYNGSTLIQSDATSPYSITWSNVAAGTYTITAKATDNAGATKTSSAVTVTVKTVTTPPTNPCTSIPQYTENGGYVAGSKVKNAGNIYECKPWPYSGWCNGASWAYAAGTGSYWADAWTLSGSCTAAAEAGASIVDETALTNAPNPFSGSTSIEVTVANEGNVSLKVYDKTGKEVAVLVDGYLSAGKHHFELNGTNLLPDLYIVHYQNNEQSITKKIIKAQ